MIKYTQNKKKILNIIAILLSAIFVYSGLIKILTYKNYLEEIEQSPLLKMAFGSIPWVVPTIELIVSVLLLLNRYRLIALIISLLLYLIFIIYLIINYYSPYDVKCGCGGVLETLPLSVHLLLNIALSFVSSVGIYIETRYKLVQTNRPATQNITRNTLPER